jgi:hypothetical protein
MLSRKPTAIKLTQEDIQDYDIMVTAQQEPPSESTSTLTHPRKSKGKEVASAEERQTAMDERIGVTTTNTRGARR